MNSFLVIKSILLIICFGILLLNAAAYDESEYKQRLQEYYKSIGVSSAPEEHHEVNQILLEKHDLSPEEMYQKRLKEYYDNIKALNEAQTYGQQTEQNQFVQSTDVAIDNVVQNSQSEDKEYQERLKDYYKQLERIKESNDRTNEDHNKHHENDQQLQNHIQEDHYKQFEVSKDSSDHTNEDYYKQLESDQRLQDRTQEIYYNQLEAKESQGRENENHKENEINESNDRMHEDYNKHLENDQRDGTQENYYKQLEANEQSHHRTHDYYKQLKNDQGSQYGTLDRTHENYDKQPETNQASHDEYYKQLGNYQESHGGTHEDNIQPKVKNEYASYNEDYQRKLANYYNQNEQNTQISKQPNVHNDAFIQACSRPFLSNGYIKYMDAEKTLTGMSEKYITGKFQFGCNIGFQPSDPNMEVQCRNGQLSELPQCKPIEVCEGIPKPMHGHVNIEESTIMPGSRQHTFGIGTKFKFTCNQYAIPDSLSESMESECMNGESWSHHPKCIAMPTCDIFKYLNYAQTTNHYLTMTYRNVTIMHSPIHHGTHNVIPGSIMTHSCLAGYKIDERGGPLQVQCMSNGHWSEFPRCITSEQFTHSCTGTPDLNLINRNNIVAKAYKISQVNDQVTGHITFGCLDNFEPEYVDMTMTVSCVDGAWTSLPVCKPKSMCNADIQLPFGAQVIDSRFYHLPGMQNQGYLPGSYIEFSCQPRNYRQLSVRTSKVFCQNEGRWSNVVQCSN